MRPFRFHSRWLAYVLLLFAVPATRADGPSDPLRLVPIQADLLVKMERPAELIRTGYDLDFVRGALKLDVVREAYGSTNARRFFQLVAWFEKKLGADRFELVDRLAGNGVVLAVKVGKDPAPALLVVQGKDEKAVEQFFTTAVELVEEELARDEKKVQFERRRHRELPFLSLGKDVHVARLGSALLISNKEEAIKAALDTHLGKNESVLQQAQLPQLRKLLPPHPAAWFWLNLEPIRATPNGKNIFEQVKKNPFLGLVTGALFEVGGRSPFVAASLHLDRNEVKISFHAPRGREGMAAYSLPYIPPEGQNLLPPLQHSKAVVSVSTYVDLSRLWNLRKDLLGDKEVANLDKFERNSALFLGGIKLDKLLSQVGSCWRFMSVDGETSVYQVKPLLKQGTYAVVVDMRQPAFGRSMETILRGAALFGAFTVNLKMVEEKHRGITLVGYRFNENKPLEGDPQNLRFNFSPCFATVGNQFLVASTVELGREMVEVLQAEKDPPRESGATRTLVCSAGVASSLRSSEQQLLTQAVLAQAQSPESARQQLNDFLHLIEQLGNLQVANVYEQGRTRFELTLRFRK